MHDSTSFDPPWLQRIGSGRPSANGNFVPIRAMIAAHRRTDVPGPMEKKARQRIQFLHTPDGVRLAWAEAGAGPPLLKASNWLSHLEYEWESPVWRHWIRFFS